MDLFQQSVHVSTSEVLLVGLRLYRALYVRSFSLLSSRLMMVPRESLPTHHVDVPDAT